MKIDSDQPFVYAAIGASDVVGIGADDPTTESWVNVVHRRLPRQARFARLGRSGITLGQATRLEVPEAIAARPDLVTIWNCVNDAVGGVQLPAYSAVLERTLRELIRNTSAHILLLNLPDVTILMEGRTPESQIALVRGGLMSWNVEMERVADKYGERVVVFDIFSLSAELRDHPEYVSGDGFHPSTMGYRRLGEAVVEALRRQGWLEARQSQLDPSGDQSSMVGED